MISECDFSTTVGIWLFSTIKLTYEKLEREFGVGRPEY